MKSENVKTYEYNITLSWRTLWRQISCSNDVSFFAQIALFADKHIEDILFISLVAITKMLTSSNKLKKWLTFFYDSMIIVTITMTITKNTITITTMIIFTITTATTTNTIATAITIQR